MLCRVAEDMFWMSRYVERAIAVCRLIDVTNHLELDAGHEGQRDFWPPLLRLAADLGGAPVTETDASPRDVRYYLAFDPDNPNALVSCIRRARSSARQVRDSISTEMWEQINTLYLTLTDPALARHVEDDPQAFYTRVRAGAQFFQGLADCTLAHDEPWCFISLGMYLERADAVRHVLERQAIPLMQPERPAGPDDLIRWLAILRSCGSAEAYSRWYSLRIEPARVLEFLLLNPLFPQSIRYSLRSARTALDGVASQRSDTADHVPAVRSLGRLTARVDHTGVDEIIEAGLQPFLLEIGAGVARVSDEITRTYLRNDALPPAPGGVARAVLIMAAQQQQQAR